MTTYTASTFALLAALSMPVAVYAQTATDTQQPAAQGQATTQPPAVDDTQAAQPAPSAGDQVQSADKASTPDGSGIQGLIVMQDADTFLASKLIGSTVYAPDDTAIGDVNDVILSRDTKIDGVVLGVGGFLGIGEKDVAVKFDRIQMTETENGVKLVLNATKDELAAAPDFKSVEDQNAAADLKQTQEQTKGLTAVPDSTQTQTQPAPADTTKTTQ